MSLPPAGQRGVSSPRPASTTAEAAPPPPPPPPSLAFVLSFPKPAVAAGSATRNGNSGNNGSSVNRGNSESAWLSARGFSADPNTGATSGTSSGAALPTTRCRTAAGEQAGQWVELHFVTEHQGERRASPPSSPLPNTSSLLVSAVCFAVFPVRLTENFKRLDHVAPFSWLLYLQQFLS